VYINKHAVSIKEPKMKKNENYGVYGIGKIKIVFPFESFYVYFYFLERTKYLFHIILKPNG
jgi:hypothetical protein